MITSHILGFARIGKKREMKHALEAYWSKNLDLSTLLEIGRRICHDNWQIQHNAGLDFVTVGDFSWYDHVLDTTAMLGVIPPRFPKENINLDTIFDMARGKLNEPDIFACEMTKWFDTNYHYIVPEITKSQQLALSYFKLFEEITQAKNQGYNVKPVILGPLTFLWLSKCHPETFDKLSLLENMIEIYKEIMLRLKALNISWVQVDEPILGLDLPLPWYEAFGKVYHSLNLDVNILLTTYFVSISDPNFLCSLPVQGLHIDLTRNPKILEMLVKKLSSNTILSVGIVNGRNVWKNDLLTSYNLLLKAKEHLQDRLWVASSSSLLYVPLDLTLESKMNKEINSWLSFAVQKVEEVATLAKALNAQDPNLFPLFQSSYESLKSRQQSTLIHDPKVKKRLEAVDESMFHRTPYSTRSKIQKQILQLPLFPTTTIGSFAQTKELRNLRLQFKNKMLTEAHYEEAICEQIQMNIAIQEEIELDVLVHGEVERSDMVEYFAQMLQGFALTEHGWVQSYGSRLVKPPIIFGDVSRPFPMTVAWISFAQSLTSKPLKGMLTGPITMFHWSFVRDDQPWTTTVMQIALALQDEVKDLEKNRIKIIQVDEPAFREGLPLEQKNWPTYLEWAKKAFKLATSGVGDATQIHTHMCYSEFNDIIEAIAQLDADVITLETARSQRDLFLALENFDYPNEIGPGVYDVHSPRIPTIEEIVDLLTNATKVIAVDRLWVNPDCGLKTRDWTEIKDALYNMVQAAKIMREKYSNEGA